MKVHLLLFCFIIPLFSFTFPSDTIEKEFKVSIGKKLDVDMKDGGSISIEGWDKDILSVKAHRNGRDGAGVKFEFEEVRDGIRIYSSYVGHRRSHSTDIHLEVKVPRKFDLVLMTMGGAISISNIEGRMEGRTMGGELNLQGLKGTIDMTTMGGKVSLSRSDLDGRVKTMGGEVLVEDVTGDVKATSQGGNVTLRNVTRRSGEVKGREVNITTMGGDINVDDAPLGADVHTMGGDINIKSVSNFAKAKTMGGKINIDAIDGWVNATTMGGDVTVTMTGDPEKGERNVSLQSMGGDVTLTVPASLSMDLDITLAFTKNTDRGYRIVSDFPIKQEESKDWEYDHGTPRKFISGTGTIGSGKNRVTIKTVNGNVYVRKG